MAEKLYRDCLASRGVLLNPVQEVKFRQACQRAISQNSNLDFDDWVVAADIYLDWILAYPGFGFEPTPPPVE